MSADSDRIVLDTNVCLDLFVFDDPRCGRVRGALAVGDVVAVTDDACREEWLRVLHYPELRLDAAMREAATAHFDSTMRPCSSLRLQQGEPQVMPRCRDPDDQKFLDLAARVRARWLSSRDEHLLALAKRARRDGLFAIVTPSEWCAAQP